MILGAFGEFAAQTPKEGGQRPGIIKVPSPIIPPLILTVAGIKSSMRPTAFLIDGTLLSQGGQAISIAGSPVSLDASKIHIASSKILLPTITPSVLSAAGPWITVSDPSKIVVAETTLSAGGKPATVNRAELSLAASGRLIVNTGGAPIARTGLGDPSKLNFGGHFMTAESDDSVIDETTLLAGGAELTVAGTPVKLDVSGKPVVGGKTEVPTAPSTFNVAGHAFIANPSGLIIDGTGLSVGGPAFTLAGTAISLASSGVLIVGSSTVMLPNATPFPLFSAINNAGQTLAADGTLPTAGGPDMTNSGTPSTSGVSDALQTNSNEVPSPTNGDFTRSGPSRSTGEASRMMRVPTVTTLTSLITTIVSSLVFLAI